MVSRDLLQLHDRSPDAEIVGAEAYGFMVDNVADELEPITAPTS